MLMENAILLASWMPAIRTQVSAYMLRKSYLYKTYLYNINIKSIWCYTGKTSLIQVNIS